MKFLALFLALLVPLSAAWPKPSAPFYHAATPAQAEARAAAWRRAGLIVAPVAYTGSMRPWLQGGELVVLEPYVGQPLAPGMVLSFWRSSASPRVLHMAADVNDRAVYLTGINCRYSDGWVALTHINGILREVITIPAGAAVASASHVP